MDVKTYFDIKKEMTECCYKQTCSDECPMHILNNEMHVNCKVLEFDYPEVAERIIKEYIDNRFPNGHIICAFDKKYADVGRCNKYESCKECKSEEINNGGKLTLAEVKEIAKETRDNYEIKPLTVQTPLNNQYDRINMARKHTEKILGE